MKLKHVSEVKIANEEAKIFDQRILAILMSPLDKLESKLVMDFIIFQAFERFIRVLYGSRCVRRTPRSRFYDRGMSFHLPNLVPITKVKFTSADSFL